MKALFISTLTFSTVMILSASYVAAQDGPSPVYEHLKDLECFVGTWEAKGVVPSSPDLSETPRPWAGKAFLVRMTVTWAPDKSAQLIKIVGSYPDGVKITSSGLRGWDQSTKKLREYEFTTHKGVWKSTVTKDGNTWLQEYSGHNLDGAKCSGTMGMKFEGKDKFIQTDRGTVDGKKIPEMVLHFTRVSPTEISEHLKPLGFLVGDWVIEEPADEDMESLGIKAGEIVRTTLACDWILAGRCFEVNMHSAKVGGQPIHAGTEIYTWCPKNEEIMHYGFWDSDVQGICHPKKNEVVLEYSGVDKEGKEVSSEWHYRLTDPDTLVLNGVKIVKGGEKKDDTREYVFKRKR
jgi:hypothetical protein